MEYKTEGFHTRGLVEGSFVEIDFKFDSNKYGIQIRIYKLYGIHYLRCSFQIIKYYKKSHDYKIIISYVRKYDTSKIEYSECYNIRYVFEQIYKINSDIGDIFNDKDIATIIKIVDCIPRRKFNEEYKDLII